MGDPDRTISIHIHVRRRHLVGTLAAAIFAAGVFELGSETMTLTTYYPSPAGIYKALTSTQQTILARDGGSVGIGTPSPQAKLDVAGGVRLGNELQAPACSSANAGTLRYNAAIRKTESCNGSAWVPMGVGGFAQCVQRNATTSTKGPCGFHSEIRCLAGEVAVGGGMWNGGNDALQTSGGIVEDGVPVGWRIVALDVNACGINAGNPDGTVATGSPPKFSTIGGSFVYGSASAVCCRFQ
ncbi:MAG: hypothetical protein HY078_13935 [Elusimicrobia bacterium]|nr:hypothetical protein [Elusimicrobiota bacterium]